MKRRLLIVAFFLLAGAVANVGVAWGLAIWGPFGFKGASEGYTISDGEVGWWLTRYDWIGARRLISRRASVGTWTDLKAAQRASLGAVRLWEFPPRDASPADELLAPWGQIRESSVLCGLGEHEYLTDDARGWPLRSMWCSWGTPDVCSRLPPPLRYRTAYPPGTLSHGIPLQTRKGSGSLPWIRAIPLAIWPPGFAVNTIVYATFLWLLACGLLALRRTIRTRRGLCPKCTYPMGESPVCSECGKALSKRAKVTT